MNILLIRPTINLLLLLYQWLGQHTILALVVVTALFRLALTPLMRAQHRNQQRMLRNQQALQVKMEDLKARYQDDREKLAQEQLKLYQSANTNQLGGCLLLFIQFPLIIGVYRAVIRVLAVTPLQLLALHQDLYPWMPNLSTLIPLNSRFLWLDLALRDPYLLLPFLVLLTAWFQQKLRLPATQNPEVQAISRYTQIAVLLLIAFFVINYASGLAIYLLVSNLIGIAEHYLFLRRPTVTPAHKAAPPTETG